MYLRKSLALTRILRRVIAIGISLAVLIVGAAYPRSNQSKSRQSDLRRASEVADLFISRFHMTLDFGLAFDEFGVANPALGLRKVKFFENFQFSNELVRNLDDATLRRLYKFVMSVHYLGYVYNLSAEKQEGCNNDEKPKLPDDIASTLKSFRVTKLRTEQDLDKYISFLKQLAELYKKHLPPDVFEKSCYKKGIADLNKQNGNQIYVRDGYEDFEIPKGTDVYVVNRDIFTMYLVKENGEMKVLTFGIGN
jgi:hypothetical protein